jgi:acyl-CoA dehydrogenase
MNALDPAAIRPFLDDHHVELADGVRAFARERLAPLPEPSDDGAGRREAREVLGLLGEAGWARHAVAEERGGAWDGPDLVACCLIREALAHASPLADAVFALQCLGSMPVALAGSEALRGRWLPAVAAGRAMAAFAMTEAEAGSDVGAIATRATRDGDGYRLDGAKVLISNAGLADLYVVFASTDPAAGKRGLSCFLVPADAPGLRFAGAQVLAAPHPLGELAFEGCRVGAAARLGEEGEGFKIGMATLDRLRPTVAAAACGMAARALEEATSHALSRRQFGRALGDLQLVQARLAEMATELDAARLLTYRAAHAAARGRVGTRWSAMAKAFATEAAQRAVDGAVQILGGRGLLAESPVDRLYRSVRALRIYEGTTEIQRLVVARDLLRETAAP